MSPRDRKTLEDFRTESKRDNTNYNNKEEVYRDSETRRRRENVRPRDGEPERQRHNKKSKEPHSSKTTIPRKQWPREQKRMRIIESLLTFGRPLRKREWYKDKANHRNRLPKFHMASQKDCFSDEEFEI